MYLNITMALFLVASHLGAPTWRTRSAAPTVAAPTVADLTVAAPDR